MVEDTRGCRALLGFLPEAEAMGFVTNRCAVAGDDAHRRQLWLDAVQRLSALPAVPYRPSTIRDLPPEIAGDASALLATREAKAHYPTTLSAGQLVSTEGLITYQTHIDAEYFESIYSEAPTVGDWRATWNYCTRAAPLREPLINVGEAPGGWMGGATFASHYANNTVPDTTPMVVRRIDDEKYEIVITVRSRPSSVLVLVLPDGRTILANGNHRVAALLKAGHKEVPAIVRRVVPNQLGQINLREVGIADQLVPMLLMQRPPMVTDFLDPGMVTELRLRALNWIHRINVQAQSFEVPR